MGQNDERACPVREKPKMNIEARTKAIEGNVPHRDMANAIRFLAIDAVEKAKSGHPGMPMGMADVATVLFSRFLKFNAADPAWPDRDRSEERRVGKECRSRWS